MAQARWALALSLLLLALPARAAPWQAQPMAQEEEEEEEEEAPGEGLAGPGERAVHTAGPEYQDGRGQSSVETSKVLHDILRELKMIVGGVKSLRFSSAVSRRSASAGGSGAEPDGEAEPNTVLGRADTNAVDSNSFQTYCIEGIMAVLGSMLLGMVLCCGIQVWRKRRKRLAAA